MADRNKTVEAIKDLIVQNMVMKEFFRRIYDEQRQDLNFIYGKDITLPDGDFMISKATFIKVRPQIGDPFVLEADDFFKLLEKRKAEKDK